MISMGIPLGVLCQKKTADWICGVNHNSDPYFSDVFSLWHADDYNDVVRAVNWLHFGSVNPATHECANSVNTNFVDYGKATSLNDFESATVINNTVFTLEFFVKAQSSVSVQTLWEMCADNGGIGDGYYERDLLLNADGSLTWRIFLVGNHDPINIVSTTSSALFVFNKWQHIAVVRNGNYYSFFIDGVAAGGGTVTNDNAYWGIMNLGGSTYRSPSTPANASFDEFRLTKAARYTTDFTPPNQQFPDF